MIKAVHWANGMYIIYNGKKYGMPDVPTWVPYSKLNEYLGLPADITATDAEMNALPNGNLAELPDTETLRQAAEREIQTVAQQGQSSYETAAKVIAAAPANTPVANLVSSANTLQTSYAPGNTPVTPEQAITTATSQTTAGNPTVTPTATPTTNVTTPAISDYVPPTQTVDQILNTAVDSVVSVIKDVPKPYDEVNPFFFDEQLAREAATAEYSPYYREKLTDYISKVEKTKSRSQEDMQKTLDYLAKGKEQYVGEERRTLDIANKNTNEGYAGRGLYFSGLRGKALKETSEEYANRLGTYETGYGKNVEAVKTSTARTLEDLQKEQELYNRDIGREQTTAIEGGVATRKGEAQEEYLAGMKKYYSQYPSYYNQYLTV